MNWCSLFLCFRIITIISSWGNVTYAFGLKYLNIFSKLVKALTKWHSYQRNVFACLRNHVVKFIILVVYAGKNYCGGLSDLRVLDCSVEQHQRLWCMCIGQGHQNYPLHNLAKIYMNMFTTGNIKQIRTKDTAFWPGVIKAQCLRTLLFSQRTWVQFSALKLSGSQFSPPAPGDSASFSVLSDNCTHVTHINTIKQYTHIIKIKEW